MTRSRLRLSFGGRIRLELAAGEGPPREAQALVVPQDVSLILGDVSVVIEEPGESPGEAAEQAARAPARRPGTVLVAPPRPGQPLLLQAIVYDFARVPPTCSDDVFEALAAAFEEAHRRRVSILAVQPVGVAHAGIDPAEFLRLLVQVCYSSAELGTSLRQVHLLLAAPNEMGRYEALLRDLVARGREPAPS